MRSGSVINSITLSVVCHGQLGLCARLLGLRLAVVRDARVTHAARRASRRSSRPMLMHVSSLLKLWSSRVYRDYRILAAREGHTP